MKTRPTAQAAAPSAIIFYELKVRALSIVTNKLAERLLFFPTAGGNGVQIIRACFDITPADRSFNSDFN
jgi:hypothetical protein